MAYDLKKLKGAPKMRYADHTAHPETLCSREAIEEKQISFCASVMPSLAPSTESEP